MKKQQADFLGLSGEYHKVAEQKVLISKVVLDKMKEQGLTIPEVASSIESVDEEDIKHILMGQNYELDTLLRLTNHLSIEFNIE
ncbi:hypothetical protein [Peribacillus sp. SCS-155]|uniref:hypothetical protein n=1 Tax=Peribacillus sedimenti TaxID=3115297 RepID=UPI00390592BA